MKDKQGNEITDINEAVIKELETRRLSYSSLKQFKKSPMHFAHYLFDKFERTAPMILGSLFDVLVLTPNDFEKTYVVAPVFAGTGMKARKAAFMDKNQGKEVVTMDQYQTALGMYESLKRNEIGWNIMTYPGKVQHEIKWTDKETGLKFRGFIDKFTDEFNCDLKSCADAEPNKFMRDAFNMDYPIQGAMYNLPTLKLYKQPFIYVCVETKPPYGVSVHNSTNEYIGYGFNEYKRLIMQMKMCIEKREFHKSYDFYTDDGFYMLDLPGYAKFK